ncbi:hypothetical protein FOA52_006707 [Chlamydomonas sp. UWO 241]|nr:hypothetical protein FOA52_006707 [Chlamydomonas sp. UWO 241]
MGTSLCVDQDHSKAAEGPSAGEGPSATKEASARKPLRMRWMRKKDEDEELMEPPSMSKKKGVGRKYAAGQLPPALLDRIKARDPDFGKSSSTHFTTQLDSAMDVDGLWMSQHMAAYTERKANHDHKAPAAVAAAVDPDDAAGREWLVNLFHEQDRQNAAAVQIQRAWRTYKRNSQLRAWPTLRMLESNKLVERCWKARNFRPVTRARLAQLCIEPLVPLDGEVSDWAAGDDDDGEGFNEGGEDLSPQASDSTFRRETNSSEAPGCTARYLQPTKSYAAHAGHGQPTASHSAAMPAHIVTPGSFSTPHQVSFSMQISGTGGGQRGNPASPSRAGSLGSQSPKYSFKDSALLMMSLASGGTSVLGASFRNRALSRQPSQSAPRVQRDGGEKAETSRPCVEKSEGSRLGSHLLFADRERERGEAAAAAAAPQFGREPAHSYEADGGAPADHPSPSAPPGAAGSESGPARGPSAFGYGRMLSSVRGSAGLDAAAASALAQLPDRLMASPVPPDGPPPVRAPDDNPASPMLVDDDVELVPPPAEEPKKRNAFDLMKASNLKAASQAKQLKNAKHAAAAPAAPAQAPEHPPHQDVPPATPTATPAADGPTIDATPIATSVKKKPPSSETQKSWIKTFPFIFIATAVNLATNGAVLVGCSVCREIYGANSNKSYAAGNASVYSLNDLTKHSKCDEHKDAVDAKVKKDGGSGGIVAAAHAGARAHVEVLKGLLPTLLMGALWICTELLPGLKFASLLVALTKAGNTVKFFKGNFKMTTAYKFAADFADAAIESLKESFFGDDPSLDILACFTIFDPVQYIGMGHAELDHFGNDSFQQLKDHFWSGDGLPNSPFSARGESFMATLDTEFKHVKTVIKDRLALTPSATMLNLWRFIARSSDSLMVPNIILLMNVYYVMALHTAEVERGFSIHRILKNRIRSRLMILMVDSLLRIWHLAQSFTGPRESENNSLINEAAEKLSGASLQSQGVNPPSLLKRLVEEVSRVQVSFLDRDLDEAARLLEKEGLEDVDPAVAFDVEGNIVEEEDAASGDVQLENEAATTRLRQLLEKNTPGAGRDPSGYLTHGANSQGQASGPTAAPGAGAGSPGQTQLSGNTFSGRSSMRTSIERRGSGSPPPGATAPTSRDLKRSTSRMARLSVRFDEDVPASVLGGGGMGSGGSFTAAPHPPLTQQELPAVPSGGPAEHGAARPSPSRVLMRSRQASSPASTRPATSPATSSEAASESPLLSLALRQKARSTFSSVTMSPSKRSMPRQTYSQANLRPGSERWPGAGLGGADDLAVLGGPEYDLTQLELQGEADTAVGMQPSATRLRSPRRAAPPRASASLGGGPTTTLTGVPCMAGMAASRPGMVGMSGPGQARPLSVQTHHRQDVSASAPLSCRAPMGATPSTASSSNDPLSKLPLGLRPLLASCSPGLLQATRPVSAMAQPGVAGMRNSPGGHVDVLATVKKRHSVMASRRPG